MICLNMNVIAADIANKPHIKVVKFKFCNREINKVKNINVRVKKSAPDKSTPPFFLR